MLSIPRDSDSESHKKEKLCISAGHNLRMLYQPVINIPKLKGVFGNQIASEEATRHLYPHLTEKSQEISGHRSSLLRNFQNQVFFLGFLIFFRKFLKIIFLVENNNYFFKISGEIFIVIEIFGKSI